MSNVPKPSTGGLPAMFTQKQDPAFFAETMSRGPTTNLLQYILLQSHQSKLVRDPNSPIKAGTFTIGPKATDLGPSFMAVVGPFKPHARYTVRGAVQRESFDAGSADFEWIIQKELELHAANQSGHIARTGVDVLLWVPKVQAFGSYFITGTAKDEAKDVPNLLGKVVLIGCREIVTKVSQWHVPSFEEVKEVPPDLAVPTEDALQKAARAFTQGVRAAADPGADSSADPGAERNARPR